MPAGGAASLALVAELSIVPSPWGQAIDSAIGVEVAISLVRPTAMIGIGWTLGTPWEPGRQKHKWPRLHAFGHISRSFSSHATAIFFFKGSKNTTQNRFASLAWFPPPRLLAHPHRVLSAAERDCRQFYRHELRGQQPQNQGQF